MRVVTLHIDEERFAEFKLFRDGFLTGIKHQEARHSSPSQQRKVNWHDITLSQLMVERPDLVAALTEAKGSWARAVCDVVDFFESPPKEGTNAKDVSPQNVELKFETAEEWKRRIKRPNTSGCLLIFIALFAGLVTAGIRLFG